MFVLKIFYLTYLSYQMFNYLQGNMIKYHGGDHCYGYKYRVECLKRIYWVCTMSQALC